MQSISGVFQQYCIAIILQSIVNLWYYEFLKYCNAKCKSQSIAIIIARFPSIVKVLQYFQSIAKSFAKSYSIAKIIAKFQRIVKIIVIFGEAEKV